LVVDNQFVNPWGFMLVDGQRGAWSQILYVYRVSESSIKPAIGENYVSSYNSTFHYKKQFFDAFSPGHFMVSDKTTHKMALCRVTESGYKILTDYGRFSGIDAVLSKDLLLLRRDGGVQAYSISQGTVSDIYREARNTKYGAILEHGSKKPGDYPDALYLTKSGEKFFSLDTIQNTIRKTIFFWPAALKRKVAPFTGLGKIQWIWFLIGQPA